MLLLFKADVDGGCYYSSVYLLVCSAKTIYVHKRILSSFSVLLSHYCRVICRAIVFLVFLEKELKITLKSLLIESGKLYP